MITYTYEDFEKALKNSGLESEFSQSDIQLARNNANAGMSLLNYKIDYRNATTDSQRVAANKGAEDIRLKYGNYIGGIDGSGYYYKEQTPQSFTYNAPAPEYNSKYSDKISELMGAISGKEQFSYNPETDPLYSSYKKQYTREGKRATEDVLGEVSAMTGGLPSSYAVTAASQAGNQYAAELADRIPQLYEVAYNKYKNDFDMDLAKLNAYLGLEETDYARYKDELNRYGGEKEFALGLYLEELADKRQKEQDELNRKLALAELGGSVYDYSGYEALGITPDTEKLDYSLEADKSDREFDKLFSVAVQMANLGKPELLYSLAGEYGVGDIGTASGDTAGSSPVTVLPAPKKGEVTKEGDEEISYVPYTEGDIDWSGLIPEYTETETEPETETTPNKESIQKDNWKMPTDYSKLSPEIRGIAMSLGKKEVSPEQLALTIAMMQIPETSKEALLKFYGLNDLIA